MCKFALIAVVLAGAAILLISSAKADTITINGGETPTFPPTFTTLASGASPITLPLTICCGASDSFLLEADATGTAPLPSGQFDTNTIDLRIGGPGTLILWFTETGVTSPTGTVNVTSDLTSNLISGGITSATLSTFLDPTNGVSPPNGTPLDKAAFTGIGSQTDTMSIATGPGPSLEEVYTIVATGTGVANLTIDLTATPGSAVPEPASLAFMGSGFVALVLLRRWRRAG
jgi:hypothetical protein